MISSLYEGSILKILILLGIEILVCYYVDPCCAYLFVCKSSRSDVSETASPLSISRIRRLLSSFRKLLAELRGS